MNDKALKTGGFILWFITVGVTYFVTYLIVKLSSLIPGGFLIANSFLIYTTLATKCLKDEAVKIYEVLKTKDIEKARVQVSYIVGRDTAHGTSVVCRIFGCSHKYGGFKRWRWF